VVIIFDDEIVKKVFLEKPDGRRKAGRPKSRWLDSTENDLKSKGVKRWMKKTEDRSARAVILQEALVKLQGQYAEEEEEEEKEEDGRGGGGRGGGGKEAGGG